MRYQFEDDPGNVLKYLILSLLLGCLLCGCASPAKKTGYLQDYQILGKGRYLEKYWSNASVIGKRNYSTVRISEISVDRLSDRKGVPATVCSAWLQSALLKAASQTEVHFVFEERTDQPQLKMELAITEMTPGHAGLRMLGSELGIGHAWVQVEGRIFDTKSNDQVALFSDRRRSSGHHGIKDIGEDDAGPILIREMLEQIAADLVRELQESLYF